MKRNTRRKWFRSQVRLLWRLIYRFFEISRIKTLIPEICQETVNMRNKNVKLVEKYKFQRQENLESLLVLPKKPIAKDKVSLPK